MTRAVAGRHTSASARRCTVTIMAAADAPVTTGQKTHRCLRLALVLIVVALILAVVLQSIVVSWTPLIFGWNPLPSISHAFYTPVRDVFVGTLIAASVALLALSGRSRATTLLDVCAVFAPLIAIVPVGIADPRAVDRMPCPTAQECIPVDAVASAKAGIAVYAVVVVAVAVTMALIRRRTRTPNRSAMLVSSVRASLATVFECLTSASCRGPRIAPSALACFDDTALRSWNSSPVEPRALAGNTGCSQLRQLAVMDNAHQQRS